MFSLPLKLLPSWGSQLSRQEAALLVPFTSQAKVGGGLVPGWTATAGLLLTFQNGIPVGGLGLEWNAFLWISRPDACTEKAFSLGEGCKDEEDTCWNPSG